MSSAAPEQAQGPGYAAAIGEALGIPDIGRHAPRPELGETPTRLVVWDVLALRDMYFTAGGIVTLEQTERTGKDGITQVVVEFTVTVEVAEVGPVQVVADWEPTLTPGMEAKWRLDLVAAGELVKPRPSLVEQLVATQRTCREIATRVGTGYGLDPEWRAADRRCDDLWRRARAAGSSQEELSAAIFPKAANG
ncbi:hypothetical protein [Streptomyces sp. NPDC102487]|uniref:hypothetical protein n=1 Tax=Streptomyces sp. NPDC102487 TaxID=3366182 RepID=UPI0037FB7A4F